MTDEQLKAWEAEANNPEIGHHVPSRIAYIEELQGQIRALIKALREEREKASKLQEQLAIAIEALEKTAVIYYDPHFNFTTEEIVQRHIANSITAIPILQKLKGDGNGNA